MAHNHVFVIGTEKRSLYAAVLIAVVAVSFGVFLFFIPDESISAWHRFNNPLIARVISIVFITCGLIVLIFSAREILSKSPSVIINEEYIKISSNLPIFWSEIKGFSLSYKYKGGQIFVVLYKPKEYIDRHGFIRRALLRLSSIGFPSPIIVSGSVLLNMELSSLHDLLVNELNSFQAKNA